MSRLLAHACTSPRSRQPSWPRKGCVSAAGLRVASVACWPPDVARRPFVGCPFGRRTPGSLAHVRSPAGLDGHPAGARAGRARGSIPRGGAAGRTASLEGSGRRLDVRRCRPVLPPLDSHSPHPHPRIRRHLHCPRHRHPHPHRRRRRRCHHRRRRRCRRCHRRRRVAPRCPSHSRRRRPSCRPSCRPSHRRRSRRPRPPGSQLGQTSPPQVARRRSSRCGARDAASRAPGLGLGSARRLQLQGARPPAQRPRTRPRVHIACPARVRRSPHARIAHGTLTAPRMPATRPRTPVAGVALKVGGRSRG